MIRDVHEVRSRRVRARAPLRISFAGGGTDVEPYVSQYGGAVLSTTITRYARADAWLRKEGDLRVTSMDLGRVMSSTDPSTIELNGHLDLPAAVLQDISPTSGVDVKLASEAPPGSGLGSSSALIVAMTAAVSTVTGRKVSAGDLARRAYFIERERLSIPGGLQDHWATAFGGLNLIEFHGPDQVEVFGLDLSGETIANFEDSLLLAYSGSARTDQEIIGRQTKSVKEGETKSIESLGRIKELVYELRDLLHRGQVDGLGEVLHEGFLAKQRLASGISNQHLDEIYEDALAYGATGGKVLGAGGGGYLLLACPPPNRPRLLSQLTKRKIAWQMVLFEDRGVRIN